MRVKLSIRRAKIGKLSTPNPKNSGRYKLGGMTLSTVPMIDIGPFIAGTPTGRAAVVQQVGAACAEIGFFTIVGHGVPDDLLGQTADSARRFFDLPIDEKLKVRVNAIGAGYVPIKTEALAASLGQKTPGDLKESFNIGRDFAANPWPDDPADLKDTWMRYFSTLDALGDTLMRIFALALSLPENYFDAALNPTNSFLRAINYPAPQEEPLPDQLRAGAHSDYGTLTILLPENVAGGLQVLDKAGAWIDIVSPPKSFVVNIGDMMQVWTNDRWRSTVHRVVNPPSDKRLNSRRQSLVFFHTPNENALVSCLESCMDATHPPKYAPILAGEHLRQKSTKAGTLAKS